MTTTTKTYARRDSATAYLRTAGIKREDYDSYLAQAGDKFTITLDADLNPVKVGASKPLPKGSLAADLSAANHSHSKTQKKAPAVKAVASKDRAPSVASVARDLIVAGKSNEEVFKQLQKQFKLPDSKKNYPAWYRSDCKRKGLIK